MSVRVGYKNSSLGITVCHHLASLVMTNSDPLDGFFYPTLTRIVDSFSCSPLNTSFYVKKGYQKFLNTLRCDMT